MNDQPFKRLFFALECAPEQRRAIARWRGELALRTGRPVPSENFHVTLVFLGAVEVAQIAELCAAAAKVRMPTGTISVALDKLEAWRQAGVLVLTSQETPPGLLRLVYALEQAILPFGFAQVSREYRPHLTLMRDYRGQPPEAGTAPEFWLRASRVVLYESHKGRYRELASWS